MDPQATREMNFCAFQLCFLLGEGGALITANVTLTLAAVRAALMPALGALRCLLINTQVPK